GRSARSRGCLRSGRALSFRHPARPDHWAPPQRSDPGAAVYATDGAVSDVPRVAPARRFVMRLVRGRKLGVMALGLVILGTSTLAAAQPVRTARVGVLGPTPSDRALMEAFSQGLALLGYVDGRTVTVDNRHAAGNPDGLPTLAADLV